ncbi:23S rRNA (pseudouridine(1915)-N(3))-methyltransferase RlmH [Salinarimonas ramus]|uniref:Ribosomal RNA large subunit methyltransferase H n=1 Tax=Salinarimonas ramus TaxID=690164 RepID=A0A917V9G2_9HYPH|nr:23S rRNA (pseudouridine(1915)-N(3))-methyltransferase RlmH [Salinarimonas ramus]GGK52112.1 ribosomal RNA large subunit methyltransferase H [Salinarimonas ramus]
MRLALVAIGRLKAGPERALVDRYVERARALARPLGFSGPDLVEIAESKARREADRKAEEAAALAAKLPDGALVVLDERGRSLDSPTFASRLGGFRDAGRGAATFVIGGPDGLDETLRARADLVLSFGGLTIPHQIVRALVAEQTYRALTILSGHPYHRGGET